MDRILAAGARISLTDVTGKPALVLWLCKCSLKCPFCHNYPVADALPEACREYSVEELAGMVREASRIVEAFMATGGEPLLQAEKLAPVLEEAKRSGLEVWINTSLTPYKPLEELLSRGLVDGVATDLKYPPELLTGLPLEPARRYLENLLNGLKLVASYKVMVELRIPVPRGVEGYSEGLSNILASAAKALASTRWWVIVNPLRGPPLVEVRDPEWCRRYCNPSREELSLVERIAVRYCRRVRVVWPKVRGYRVKPQATRPSGEVVF